MTTYSPIFETKPDDGYRLTDAKSVYDALVNNNALSRAYGITAAGAAKASATPLTAVINEVDTVGSNTGVNLPLSTGQRNTPFSYCVVINNGANTLTVYPAQTGSDTVNGTTSVTQAAGSVVTYISGKQGAWFTNGNTAFTGSGSVSIASGKTLTASNTLTLAGTDSTTMTFPTTSATLARTDAANTFTGHQTIEGVTSTGATGTGALVFGTAPTLAGPVINGPAPVAIGASASVAATSAGSTFLLNTAAGSTATLPAASGTGNVYKFVVSVAATSNGHKILCASSSDNIIGIAVGQNSNTAKVFAATTAGTFHSIQMPFAGTQPSGGLQGDWFTFTDIATNVWSVQAAYSAGTTPTTPFSTATS